MFKSCSYDTYKTLYPAELTLECLLNNQIQVQFGDYDYNENRYKNQLKEFLTETGKLIMGKDTCFLYLVSPVLTDTEVNRKKRQFHLVDLEKFPIKEYEMPLKNNTFIKIGIFKINDLQVFLDLIFFIIDNGIKFFLGVLKRNTDPERLVSENYLANCLDSETVIGDSYFDKLIVCSVRYKELFKGIHVFRGGFDFGQFAFFYVPV